MFWHWLTRIWQNVSTIKPNLAKAVREIDKFMTTSKPIGELNGGWAILLKISLVCFPIFVTLSSTWCGWASVAIIQNSYFRVEATKDIADSQSQIRALEMQVPPEARIVTLEESQKQVVQQTTRILVEIEYLKQAIAKNQ